LTNPGDRLTMSGLASQVLPNEDSLYAGPWNRRPVGSALRAVGAVC
jgi:hypothetical protein